MSYSVQEFLTFLKLEEYLPKFINNDISNLHNVDESLLINIGINKVGHRKRFLRELETLLGTGKYIHDDSVNNNTSTIDMDDDDDDVPPPLPPKQRNFHNGKPQKPPKPPRSMLPDPRPIQLTAQQHDGDPNRNTSELPHQPSQPAKQTSIPQRPPIPPVRFTQLSKEQRASRTRSMDLLSFDDVLQDNKEILNNGPTTLTVSSERSERMLKRNTMSSFDSLQAIHQSAKSAVNNRFSSLQGRYKQSNVDSSDLVDMTASRLNEFNTSNNSESLSEALFAHDIPNNLSDNEGVISSSETPFQIKLDKGDNTSKETSGGASPMKSSIKKRNVSFDPDATLDSIENDDMDNMSNASTSVESPSKDLPGFMSADDISDDEDTSFVNDLEGVLISLKKDQDELIDIVRHRVSQQYDDDEDRLRRDSSLQRKSRFFQNKTGYLITRGEGKGKRWVEFTGTEIKCFKDKNGILKLTIPVLKITDVIWEKNAKKPTFHIDTKTKRYTFTEPSGDHDALTIWANVILEGVMGKGDDGDDVYSPGGVMANPDIEGYLSKEMQHNILHDVKRRYVVIKENKLCYYNSKEDFENDCDFISCLEMALVSLKTEEDKLRLNLYTHTNKSYTFVAEDLNSFNSWKEAIETSIQYGIGDDEIKNQIQENQSNMKCADCGEDNPIYASINLLVVTCSKCTGFHREMGCHISKARSLLMDKYVWTPSLIQLFQTVGNVRANSLWAHRVPSDDCIVPRSTRDDREQFIFTKYKERKYFNWSPLYGQPKELGDQIRKVVVTDDVLETLQLLISEADIYYVPEGSVDQRTPYELAKDAGMDLQVELLYHFNGHLTKEERTELQQQRTAMQQTSGILQVRTTRSDTMKERQCTLTGKKIEMKRMDKLEEGEIIDLSKLEEMEIDKEDPTTLILKLAERSYFLKAYVPEEANMWYRAVHNKQVFGVAIENQECNDKKIPCMIAECISFMEQHSLMTAGTYRLNGSQVTIKKLVLLFNQDARNVRLSIDEFPDVHAVAGLIKLYFRQLPDPLLTKALYEEWIRNADDTITEEGRVQKLYRYKSLLQELPRCNYITLRFVILHLSQVISLSQFNKMGLANIIVIFGPILVSCGNTVDQAWLKREYNILSDMLTYYQWLFEVSEVEVKVLQGMTDFHLSTQQLQQQPTVTDTSTMVTIFVGTIEDQMKMSQTTKSSEVCLFCIKKHKLSVNTNWGLFETTMEGDLERLVHASESVLKLAEHMGVKRKLVVKCNNVPDLIATHTSNSLCISGHLHFSKGDRWRKNCYIEIKTGNIRIYKQKGNNKEEENIPIHETELFFGNHAKKKPPAIYGFALSKTKEGEFRYFCHDDEIEVNKFAANILLIRHPSGMWSPISDTTEETGIAECLNDPPSWGRQSAVLRPMGTSQRLLTQLDKKRQTLRNIFK